MITEKDFKWVGIRYYNKNLAFDPTYSYSEVIYSDGGCKLSGLKNPLKRCLIALLTCVDVSLLTNKNYKDKVLKLTCDKSKLADLTTKEFTALKDKVVETLNAWKLNIQDVLIYGI